MTDFRIRAVYGLLIALTVTLCLSSYQVNKFDATNAPDFQQQKFYSALLEKSGSVVYCNPLNDEIDSIIGIRGEQIIDNGCHTHSTSQGHIAILAEVRMFAEPLSFLLVPLFALIALIYVYLIAHKLCGIKVACTAVIIAGTTGSFMYHASTTFNNVPAAAMFIACVYYGLQYRARQSLPNAILAVLLLCAAFWLRYPDLIFGLVFFVWVFWADIIRLKWKRLSGLLLVSLLVVSPFFFINYVLFGSPVSFTSDRQIASADYYFRGSDISSSFVSSLFDVSRFMLNFNDHLWSIIGAVMVLSILSAVKDIKSGQLSWASIFLLTALVNVWFYFTGIWSGYESDYTIATSYARYILIAYFLISIVAAATLLNVFTSRNLLLTTVFAVLVAQILLFASAYSSYYSVQSTFAERQSGLISPTTADAVIFTSYYDKFIFPKRLTAIYTTYPEENRTRDTAEFVSKLVSANRTVYFIKSDWATNYDVYSLNNYSESLHPLGLRLVPAGSRDLFIVERLS